MNDAHAVPEDPDAPDSSNAPADVAADQAPSQRIRLAAGLVALEGLALVALAIAELVQLDSDHPSVGITSAIFFLLYAAGLGLCARGLLHLSSWCRGPIVLAQLIELGIAWSFYGDGTYWVSILLAVPAAIVLVVMLSPSTTEALFGSRLSES